MTKRIHGDGDTSRDFCYVRNAVLANILAATASSTTGSSVYNVAIGDRTSHLKLHDLIRQCLSQVGIQVRSRLKHTAFREGDVRHSQAAIEKISEALGYSLQYSVKHGLKEACEWFVGRHQHV